MTPGVPYAEVIGDPIAHSKSPLIHNFWLEKLGIEGDYRAARVPQEGLDEYFAARAGDANWLGCNVTVPHKRAVMPLLHAVDPEAEGIGAVNTVIARQGHLAGVNTDDAGFLDSLRHVSPSLSHVTLIGAGGAARAVLNALAKLGARNVTVVNRSEANALALGQVFPCMRTVAILRAGMRLPPSDLIVNATSLGMTGMHDLDVDLAGQASTCVICDIVYSPLETPLLAQARARGLKTIDGLGMLMGQAAAAFLLFFGQPAPREHDDELRALLTA